MLLLNRTINHVGISWVWTQVLLHFPALFHCHSWALMPPLPIPFGVLHSRHQSGAKVNHCDLYWSSLCCRSCMVLAVPSAGGDSPSSRALSLCLCWPLENLQDIPVYFPGVHKAGSWMCPSTQNPLNPEVSPSVESRGCLNEQCQGHLRCLDYFTNPGFPRRLHGIQRDPDFILERAKHSICFNFCILAAFLSESLTLI